MDRSIRDSKVDLEAIVLWTQAQEMTSKGDLIGKYNSVLYIVATLVHNGKEGHG
jgi:hypothetical protein